MNGQQSISIAVLSRDQDDVALINGTLRDAGHAAHCHWVATPDALFDTLGEHRVELIILNCDRYADPVRAVIKQKHRFNPEVPVIAMAADADEKAIQEALLHGACDLVSTGRKRRLQAVVSRELRALRVERALNSTLTSATSYRKQVRHYMRESTNAIAVVAEGIIVEANESWLKLFKLKAFEDIDGTTLMDSFDPDSHAAVKGALVATVAGKWAEDEVLKARAAHEDTESYDLRFRPIDDDGTRAVQVIIAPPANANEPTKLVHDALKRDPTTYLFHRAQLLERINKRLSRKPASGLHVLAYIKPDGFGELAQKIGYINSEEILAQFAEEVRKRLHPRDVAGRFEGTALMVLLERGNANDAEVWGNQLARHIEKKSFDVGEHSTHMTCSIGVCAVSDVFGSLEELVAATIDAWRHARNDGGNRAMLSQKLAEDTRQREFDAIWVKHLKSALMDNRFKLASLPIAGLRSDSVRMYDLLVRMIDEQGNSVLPSEFLGAAERNNMMKNIDRWMMLAAMDFCDEHDADRVFVRLSRQSIIDGTSAAWLQQEFEKREFDCSRLVIQVPERDAAKHIKQTRALVGGLKKLGVAFALEHYGVDQERFQILDMLKPDYIKIDGELMHSLMTERSMQASVERIVAAARQRNIRTVAERVENANAMAVLFQLGLDYMQGHYVHEPEVVLEDRSSGKHTTLDELAAANTG
ncbi:MAG: EAL domain-containing protein [Woeseiaceae bacterium]|nr:EAL domain-containing protein [Woeseiaceae bacterium]